MSIWKRFSIIERLLAGYFVVNFLLVLLGQEFSLDSLYERILAFSFFLSLGLWVGFILCKYELKKVASRNIAANRTN